MAVAEVAFKQPPAERVHHVADHDLRGWPRQRVAAFLAARRLPEPALAQHPQDLGGIRRRHTLRLADFRNRQGLAGVAGVSQPHQAAHAVLLVGAELHLRSLAIGKMSSSPSASMAASDIRSLDHGGSKPNSSLTSVTPGTARIACSTEAVLLQI